MDFDACILQARNGDLTAYEDIMREHHKPLREFVIWNCPLNGIIEDIAQETFVYAFENLDDYTLGTNFQAWIKAIARNKIRDALKKRSREIKKIGRLAEEQILRHHEEMSYDRLMIRNELFKHLQQCMGKLDESSLRMIQRRYKDKTPVAVLADELGLSLSTAKVRLHRLRQALRECIEQYYSSIGLEVLQ